MANILPAWSGKVKSLAHIFDVYICLYILVCQTWLTVHEVNESLLMKTLQKMTTVSTSVFVAERFLELPWKSLMKTLNVIP